MSDANEAELPRTEEEHTFAIQPAESSQRLDAVLANRFPEISRSRFQSAMRRGSVLLAGKPAKPSHRVSEGQIVSFQMPSAAPSGSEAEAIPLHILFEDEHLAAVDKPAGMVVHPAKGHWQGTLTAALLHHFQSLSAAGGPTRPGIIHRLDRDTSGVIVIAKTDQAHSQVTQQFARRSVMKEYLAIVSPPPDRDRDLIDMPIGVHPYHRERMAIRAGHPSSRPAQTFFEAAERFRGFALLKVLPKTGRTHQIRVHLSARQTPVVADRLYSGRSCLRTYDLISPTQGPSKEIAGEEVLIDRQALHSHRLELDHPVSGERLRFKSDLPEDMQRTLAALRHWRPLGL